MCLTDSKEARLEERIKVRLYGDEHELQAGIEPARVLRPRITGA
jgi:hypothetical protein